MTLPEARHLAGRLAVAIAGPEQARRRVVAELERLDGRCWLLLDAAARRSSYLYGPAIGGITDWSAIAVVGAAGSVPW